MARYIDRVDAGRVLAQELLKLNLLGPVCIGLPRGGVPVAAEVARALHAPLEVQLVRKIGAPMQRELAIGAIADGDPLHIVLDQRLIKTLGVDDRYVDAEIERQIAEIDRRRVMYDVPLPAASLRGHVALLIDDGLATGATTRAAIMALREREPESIVLAVPVAAADSIELMRSLVDTIVCPAIENYFSGVGAYYRDFTQVDDMVVVDLLRSMRREAGSLPVR